MHLENRQNAKTSAADWFISRIGADRRASKTAGGVLFFVVGSNVLVAFNYFLLAFFFNFPSVYLVFELNHFLSTHCAFLFFCDVPLQGGGSVMLMLLLTSLAGALIYI